MVEVFIASAAFFAGCAFGNRVGIRTRQSREQEREERAQSAALALVRTADDPEGLAHQWAWKRRDMADAKLWRRVQELVPALLELERED